MLLGLIFAIVVSIAFPYVTAVGSYAAHHGAWQGRYGLPFAVGIVVLAGFALDRTRTRVPPRFAVAVLPMVALAQVVSPVLLLRKELATSPMEQAHLWPSPSPWFVAVAAAVGSGLMCWGAVRHRSGTAST